MKGMFMSDSIFSRIIRREIPAVVVYEDDEIIAINDIAPKAPVHVLIIPKKPIPTINDLEASDADLMGRMILVARDIALKHGIAESGYRLVFNCNADAGQEVFHIHCHLMGGKKLK